MDFGCETSDHIQDLSEWSESLYLDEFSQHSEAQEEPLAKRQRTETTDDLPPRAGEMFREPAWFDCRGNYNCDNLTQMLPQRGYLASGVFSAVSHNEDCYPQFYNKCVIRLFEAKFLTASALTFHLEKLFFLLRQQVAILENDGSITSFTDDRHSRSLEVRRTCGEFMAYVLHYTHHYRGSSQDNSKTILLSPSTLTKELDELLLYLGRLSSLPSAFVITEPVPATSSLRLTSGGHTFHLHLEMTWAAIEAMYLILETPHHLDKLSSDHYVDTINSINKATLSLVWDLIAIAVSLFRKARQCQTDVLKVSPFPCGCVAEIWIMLIHLMDHLSTRTNLQSFWSAVSSIMSEIVQSKITVSDSQESGFQSFAPPGLTVGSPVTFCWWLLTHLSPLYWVTDKGMYSHRKKGCVPGNWVLVQELLKVSLQSNTESNEESHRRFCLRCCLSLSSHWSANSDLLLWLWDYFHKRMNESFHIPGQSLHGIAVLSSSALQWMEQCLNRSKETSECTSEQESSYNLFLRIVSVHLTKLLQSGSLRAWKQIKGRFYSKFNKRRMEDLNSTGLYQFITLFLTLSCVADLEDAANKMCSLLELLDFDSMLQDKKTCVWKGLFALLLVHKENKVDLGYMAERLSQKFATVAREYAECSSLDKHHQRNCWQLISLYLDNTQDVFEHKNKQDLSEAKLLGGGFQWLFRSCRNNELRYLLNFVQTTLTSITQRSRKDKGTGDAVIAMWQQMFSHVRALVTDVQAMQSVSNHVADTLASFTLSSVDRHLDVVDGLPDVSFASLVQELGTQDEVPASFCCRLLCHVLSCSAALEAIERERMEGHIIHTWFRCLVQLSPSHEGLTELTRAVSKLPEMEAISRSQPGFGSSESSERSLQIFVVGLGVHFASLNTFDDTIQFKQKVQIYLGDVMKYTDHVLRSGGPSDQLRLAYHVAGLLTKHCYKIIYSKTQPKCLLPRLVDQFVLPLPNAKKPVSPPVMQCIKTYLHQFLQGLAFLDFKRDEFIRRKIKQVFTTYFRLFNQKCQATPHPGNTPTKNPFLVVLKDSLLPNPSPESSDFRHFVIELIRESFLCLPQPPVNLTSTLFFLEKLFRRTLCPAETARNTPVILNAITGCLLACNEFAPENEPLDIRRQADEILRMMLLACRKTPQVTSRDNLLPHLRDFLYTNMMRNQGLVFRTFETLASFDPDLLVELIPDAKQAVVQSEQKRGVGTDLVLRGAFKSFLKRLGIKGQTTIKALEQESRESQ